MIASINLKLKAQSVLDKEWCMCHHIDNVELLEEFVFGHVCLLPLWLSSDSRICGLGFLGLSFDCPMRVI